MTKEEEKELIGKVEELGKKLKEEAIADVKSRLEATTRESEKQLNDIILAKTKSIDEALAGLKENDLKDLVGKFEEMNKEIALVKSYREQMQSKDDKTPAWAKALRENFEDFRDAVGRKSSYKIDTEKYTEKVSRTDFGDRVVFGFRETGVALEALPQLNILAAIPSMNGGPGSDPLTWVEQNIDLASGDTTLGPVSQTAEGADKKEINYEWVEGKVNAETIAAWLPITKQAANKYPMVENDIRTDLIPRLFLEIQRQALYGTNSSGQIKGINEYAQAFDAGAFAGKYQDPSLWHVLRVAYTQILNANHVPTHALVTPDFETEMLLSQGNNGAFLIPALIADNGMRVSGMSVLVNNQVGTVATDFFVGDLNKSLINYVEAPNISTGFIDKQFIKNQYSLLAEAQLAHRIKKHDETAFVKGLSSTALAAITGS
jgi:hypothetical protein